MIYILVKRRNLQPLCIEVNFRKFTRTIQKSHDWAQASSYLFIMSPQQIPLIINKYTLPETNMAPENGWLEY